VASDGTQGDDSSAIPSISADGRYVAFQSRASNLVPGDTNGHYNIFVHDRQTGETSRVSVASDGTQGNGSSTRPSISADGRYVAFESWSTNLVPADTNDYRHIIIHDRQTGHTTRVSVASDGIQGNGHSDQSSISADGRYVTFHSEASNLVPGDTNGTLDVFVHDRGASGALPLPSPSLSPTPLTPIQATPTITVVVVPSETVSEAPVQSTATLVIQEDEPSFAAADSLAGHGEEEEVDDRMMPLPTTERDSGDNWMGLAVAGILAVAGLILLFTGGMFIWRQRVSAVSPLSAICPNCGIGVAASARFCFRCGRQLRRE
jgi:archaellum component FlaF (FlaF/FlaG flagellin family)